MPTKEGLVVSLLKSFPKDQTVTVGNTCVQMSKQQRKGLASNIAIPIADFRGD